MNLETNSSLKRLVEEAFAQNVPRATVEKMLKRPAKLSEISSELLWEIRGPGRVAVLVECLAPNRGAVQCKINPILRKCASTEERGISSMFDKERIKLGFVYMFSSFCQKKENHIQIFI